MVKMVDVAKSAGVSTKTVSRVLNNEPHVRDNIREKVLKAVKELGYIPSASARHLRSNRSYALHIISHTLNSNFVNAIQSGALFTSQKHGYKLVLSLLETSENTAEQTIEWCENLVAKNKPDGFILIPPYNNDKIINNTLAELKIPIIRIGPNNISDNNETILIDDFAAARDIVNHLISLGHKRIAFVRGLEDQDSTHKRFQGYKRALEDANIKFDDKLVFCGEFDFVSGMIAGEKMLDLSNPPSSVFAANDDMAAGVLVSALKRNIKIPEQLSIAGFDDSELAEKMWPQITTVRQPIFEFGKRAAEILISKNSSNQEPTPDKSKIERLNYKLILRNSTSKLVAN
ncbi:MAG: LacI family DNA-binding transcriptional regulator [Maricaulaceae bacterium]